MRKLLVVDAEKIKERLRSIVEPVVVGMGYELFELKFIPASRSVLKVIIDHPSRFISIRDCELVSKQISPLLDIEDVIPSSYLLEVSSPGADRPLKTERDFERFKGSEVEIKTKKGVFSGRLVGRIEGKVYIKAGNEIKCFGEEEIREARLKV